jgi:F-type H+-transporting ATPase subunit c
MLSMAHLSAGLGAGMAVIGAGYGISRLAQAALDGSARQPQAAGDLRTTMIIAAALIEGVALFAEVICILLSFKA